MGREVYTYTDTGTVAIATVFLFVMKKRSTTPHST
jgi:hypothetical protein